MTASMTSTEGGVRSFFTRSSPRTADSGSRRRDSVEVRSSRCPHCLIEVQTIGKTPPTICPYCRRAMVQSTQERTVAPPMEPPSQEEVKARLKAIYHPPHFIFGFIVAIGAVGLLAWAVTLQLNSIENYFYQPLVSIYSIIAGAFVITRFIFAAFYKAPAEADFEPTLTVLVPCFNEGLAIRKTLERIFSSGYPLDKLEVVCVNDGSSDDSLVHIQEAQTNHPGLVLVNFEKNRGLCHGWGVATFLARGEFMVCVDSDTFVFPGSLHKLMQGFVDPTVGGISGHCDIENANVNMLTRMQDVRYYFSYKIMKAAESVFGTVSCLPGCFSAYRRTCVLAVMDDWINATVWGKHGRELRRRPFAHEPHPEGLQDHLRRPGARDDDLPRRVEAVRAPAVAVGEVLPARNLEDGQVHVAQAPRSRAFVVRHDVDADRRARRDGAGACHRAPAGGDAASVVCDRRVHDHAGVEPPLLDHERPQVVVCRDPVHAFLHLLFRLADLLGLPDA